MYMSAIHMTLKFTNHVNTIMELTMHLYQDGCYLLHLQFILFKLDKSVEVHVCGIALAILQTHGI